MEYCEDDILLSDLLKSMQVRTGVVSTLGLKNEFYGLMILASRKVATPSTRYFELTGERIRSQQYPAAGTNHDRMAEGKRKS